MLRLSDERINVEHWGNLAGSLPKCKVADRFLSEEECEEAVFQYNWELGYRCPNCQFEDGIWSLKTRRMYQCPKCRHQYSVRADSPLTGKHVSILDCFKGAEWMIATVASNSLGLLTIKNSRRLWIWAIDLRELCASRCSKSLRSLLAAFGGAWSAQMKSMRVSISGIA